MFKFFAKPLVLISLIFWIVSIVLFMENGVKNVNDSQKYLEYAKGLRQGFYFDKHNFWYIGYVLFILLIQTIHESELAIIVAQYAMSYFAVISLYKTYDLLFKNQAGAIIACLCYILFVEILWWNSYILCESFYCSLTCISFYLLAMVHNKNRSTGLYFLSAAVIIFTGLTKPTGMALLFTVVLMILLKVGRKIKNKLLQYSLALGTILVIIFLADNMLTSYSIIEHYRYGEVVSWIRTIPSKQYLLVITPPDNLYIPSEDELPLLRILYFAVNNSFYWTKLFLAKLFYFLVHIRPYWSLKHNAFVLLFLSPIYFYAIRGMVRGSYEKNVTLFMITYLSIHMLAVSTTFVDWDGRFLMPLLPAIFLLAATEFVSSLKSFNIFIKRSLFAIAAKTPE